MAITTLKINSIFGGQQPSQYFGGEDTYLVSLGVDPDLPIVSSDIRTSGFVVPVGYAKFSGANVTAAPIRILNDPKNTLTYTVTTDGKLISYNSSLAAETLVGTVAGSNARWAEYYNNYIYIFGTGASKNDVSRYGPLDNSPSLTDAVWTGATLGSQTALTDTTYPSLRSVMMPNHVAHVHGDNSLYFCDFKNGQGMIHKIRTTKVTNEGDTNNTSLYDALSLPFGFYPTAVESYNTSLFILGVYTTDTTVNQGRSAFILWDTTNTVTFSLGPVFLPDPLATALVNKSGIIHIWSGNAQNGVRLSKYYGGEYTTDILFQEEGLPPFAGAVDTLGNRLVWGGFITTPSVASCVFAYGSKDARLPAGLHNIAKTSSAGATPIVTALKYAQQSSNITPKLVIGWNDAGASGLDQYSTSATLGSKVRWMFNTGVKFNVKQITIPLAGAVAANTTIQPTCYFDDLSITKTPQVINNTNNPGKRKIIYADADLRDFIGQNNFVFELAFTGTNPLPVGLPITIDIEYKSDESTTI